MSFDDATIFSSPDADAVDNTQSSPVTQSTMSMPHIFDLAMPIHLNSENAASGADTGSRHTMDQQNLEHRVSELRHQLCEQLSTIFRGSQEQNNFIDAHEKTIAEQRQELEQVKGELDELRVNKIEQSATITELRGQVEQTKAVNANLEGQINDMRIEVKQLRTLLLSFAQGRLQQDQDLPEEPMEIDLLGANEQAWLNGRA